MSYQIHLSFFYHYLLKFFKWLELSSFPFFNFRFLISFGSIIFLFNNLWLCTWLYTYISMPNFNHSFWYSFYLIFRTIFQISFFYDNSQMYIMYTKHSHPNPLPFPYYPYLLFFLYKSVSHSSLLIIFIYDIPF